MGLLLFGALCLDPSCGVAYGQAAEFVGLYLTALRDRFSNCIGCGCLSLESCPYPNPDDVLGAEGQGALRLS